MQLTLEDIKKELYSSEAFQAILKAPFRPQEPQMMSGICGSLWAFIASFLFEEFHQQLLVITSERDAAEKIKDDCALLVSDANVRLFSADPPRSSQLLDMSTPVTQIETLRSLAVRSPGIYIAYGPALAFAVPTRAQITESIFELTAHTDTPFQKLLENLSDKGFERKSLVETYGDFAVRGGIVDIFPFVGENPLRLEFWGDTIESIREFDALSQRSIRELERATIAPSIERIRNTGEGINNVATSLLDFFSEGTLILTDEPGLLEKEFKELEAEGIGYDFPIQDLKNRMSQFPNLVRSSLHTQEHNPGLDFHSTPQPAFNGSMKILLDHIQQLRLQQYRIVIASDTKEEAARIRELITGEAGREKEEIPSEEQLPLGEVENLQDLQENGISYISETLHAGFVYQYGRIAFLTEHEIFGRIKKRGPRKHKRFKGISGNELKSLHKGDYVVHIDHGIGRFVGLQKISIKGNEQEVAKLEYAERSTLFVNLNYINRIQKYSSAEGHLPVLNRLGSGDWEKLKNRAKKKIKDIARDLILLYAKRKHEQGFAFSPDTHWQKEMEASFMFEDTPDQAQATADVKKDMESQNPMDRLVCGDVGFGKTEVAIRAAFKAVLDGKQVALLVPTTILAQQHFNTFSDRLGKYAVRIESLSRFKSSQEQKKIVESLKNGTLDIVLGTHRLLSKDISFKNLGLLIIDEEQRFGVASKEKLRSLKAAVDTLTLTATPIPRTLHFSLLGARDLSIINTPPRNRLPIYTEIAQFDKKIIQEAVVREMHRNGQVYIVNDRVENIDRLVAMVQEIIPGVKIRVAHGQMHGHELEKVMMDFLQKKFNVLVTTKIIESGLDIPSVNTIIINRADRFGLAELYQLRGRVGRSNVQAYAYLLIPPISSLPKTTLRRLQAIEEFTELGSGFNLAMRDLEIRGAGNMLGAEQSGFIMDMGFEMYTRTLEEAVNELKEQEFSEFFEGKTGAGKPSPADTVVEAELDAYIPELYVENDTERLDIYRRLYKAISQKEIDDIRAELRDRFGSPLEEVENLFSLIEVRTLSSQAGFRKTSVAEKTLKLYFPAEDQKEFYDGGKFTSLMKIAGNVPSYKLSLRQEGKQLFLQTSLMNEDPREQIDEVRKIIGAFID
jgi:transcription-repair coupling factor (superfamily II helicase)